MGVKTQVKFDMTKRMKETAENLDGVNVYAGVLTGEHQWLAGIHEYGCKIPVTKKMRNYLHSIGVHLKKDTTEIVIPERSFLRAGYDKNKEDILRKAENLLPDLLGGTLPYTKFLEAVGTELRDCIKDFAIELDTPQKKEWPTRDPDKYNQLVETGDMINGIEYEVER